MPLRKVKYKLTGGIRTFVPPLRLETGDGFEFSDGWPGTVADTNPQPTFSAVTIEDGFETADSWPGT